MLRQVKATCYVCEFCRRTSPLGKTSEETSVFANKEGWGTWGYTVKGRIPSEDKVVLRCLCSDCLFKVKHTEFVRS